jgi:hypothetical protein
MRRFAKYWDLIGNSGNFLETTPLIWSQIDSPFGGFMRWSDWLYERVGRTDTIALARLAEMLFTYLTEHLQLNAQMTAETLWRDYQRGGRREKLEFMRPFIPEEDPGKVSANRITSPKRQARHLARVLRES